MSQTPDQKWRSAILDYRKKCQKIVSISKAVRYAGVINEYGRTLTGIIRPGLKPILGPEDAKNEFFIISNLITLRNSQSKALGNLDDVVLKHKKATLVCIPSSKVIYYVSLNPQTKDLNKIIGKIKGVV